MNKVILLMLLSLSFSFSFAQVFEYEDVTIEIEKLKITTDLDADCISLLIKIKDDEVGQNLRAATILIEGQNTNYPYLTNRAGEVLMVTENKGIKFTITPEEPYYSPVTLGDLPIEKGNSYQILVKVRMPTPIEQEIKEPIRVIENVSYKPIIYLYPTQATDLTLKLKVQGELTFSYPKHNDNWTCTAYPNGDIKMGEKTYPYLFWEGKLNPIDHKIQKTGFVVKSEDVVAFLEEKLAHIGLNDKEMTDFITFWAPRLEQNAYNYLHFSIGEEYAKNIATLDLTIQPDAELHLHLFHAPVGPDFKVQSQKLPSFARKGFSLVEWGGGPIQLTDN
jgi:hypothetical protein